MVTLVVNIMRKVDFVKFDMSSSGEDLDFTTNHLVDCGNGLMLTNGEISVLKRFGINYLQCTTLKEILFRIDEVLKEEYDEDLDELDSIATTIAERDYYQNTNK